jgi:hypothetical protein
VVVVRVGDTAWLFTRVFICSSKGKMINTRGGIMAKAYTTDIINNILGVKNVLSSDVRSALAAHFPNAELDRSIANRIEVFETSKRCIAHIPRSVEKG